MPSFTSLTASDARAAFPSVVGPIVGADLYDGFAIIDMGPGAYAVIVGGEFIGCCPTYAKAKWVGAVRVGQARKPADMGDEPAGPFVIR